MQAWERGILTELVKRGKVAGIATAAKRAGVSRQALHAAVKRGLVTAWTIDGRCVVDMENAVAYGWDVLDAKHKAAGG